MALHFPREEYQDRIQKTLKCMRERNLDALLIFGQESMYYLTGYDTFGFCFFQCLILNSNGNLCLITRSPDLRQAQLTSIIDDIQIWSDRQGQDPVLAVKKKLGDMKRANRNVGVEYDSYGLNASQGFRLRDSLEGFCRLSDASGLIRELRAVKSPAEIEYVKKAGCLADEVYRSALNSIKPGAYEGDILADMQSVVFRGGGEYSGNEFIVGSGKHALLCRSKAGRQKLGQTDQITLEYAATYMRYHAAMMRTPSVGKITDRQKQMFDVTEKALYACREKISPEHCMGDVFEAYANVCDKNGMREHRLNATGYSLGAVFAPTWMDFPMFFEGNRYPILENMVLFLHIILMDSQSQTAMTFGETYRVKSRGHERLSQLPVQLDLR